MLWRRSISLYERLAIYFGSLMMALIIYLIIDLKVDLDDLVATGRIKYYDSYYRNEDYSVWKNKFPVENTKMMYVSKKHITENTNKPRSYMEKIVVHQRRLSSNRKLKTFTAINKYNRTEIETKPEVWINPLVKKNSTVLPPLIPSKRLKTQLDDSNKAVPFKYEVIPKENNMIIPKVSTVMKNLADGNKMKNIRTPIEKIMANKANNVMHTNKGNTKIKTSSLLGSTETSSSTHFSHSKFYTIPNNTSAVSISDRNDKFDDLKAILNATIDAGKKVLYETIIIPTKINSYNPTIGELMRKSDSEMKNTTNLEKFQMLISKHELYRESEPLIDAILHDMQNLPVVAVEEKFGGTQFKLTITFPNNIQALYKPIRCPREEETYPNRTYFSDLERHNAEIAAFHLDRALGFRRTMPVTGRILDINSEIYKFVPLATFNPFVKPPDNNLCFYTQCHIYCDKQHAICGNPDKLEGSFAAYLPQFRAGLRDTRTHPWRRTYQHNVKAEWETNDNYCDKVRKTPPFDSGRFLLDLMDLAILDFLAGNQDRHHFETFKIFSKDNDTSPVYYDHGRGHGRAYVDDLSILAPVTQCCLIRASTLDVLLKFHIGPKHLSHIMRESMSKDPIAPILWEPHLEALDRRVILILKAMRDCVNKVTPASISENSYISSNSDNKNE